MRQRYIFLSYSKADKTFAKKLVSDLEVAGLQMWIDEVGIEPGTPNWDHKIREAIHNSYAIVLVCSPNIVDSQNVYAELKLAQKYGRQILPVWATGDAWIDCIPLSLVNYQYIDFRNDSYESGLAQLIKQLCKYTANSLPKLFIVNSLEECPTGFVPILVPKNDTEKLDLDTAGHIIDLEYHFDHISRDNLQIIAANPAMYSSVEKLLDDLYTHYLRNRYEPYTYGRDWILAKPSIYVSLLAVPWVWLKHKRKKLLIDVIPNHLEQSTPLEAYGMGVVNYGSNIWAIINKGFEKAYGLFTSNQDVAVEALRSPTKGLSFILERCQRRSARSSRFFRLQTGLYKLEEVNPTVYQYKFVVVPDAFVCGFKELTDESFFIVEDIPRI